MQRLRDFAGRIRPEGFLLALVFYVAFSFLSFSLGLFAFAFLAVFAPLAVLLKRRKALVAVLFLSSSLAVVLFGAQSRGEAVEGSFSGIVIDARDSYFLLETMNGRYLVYEENSTRERLDFLRVEGRAEELMIAHYESRFSFEEYLNKKGVYKEIRPEKIEEQIAFPFRLRAAGVAFLRSFDEKTAGVVDSVLFGRGSAESMVVSSFEAIGALFYLSGSGTLLGAFAYAVEYVASLKLRKGQASGIATGIVIALSFAYPFKVGILRVALSRLAKCLLYARKKPFSPLVPGLLAAFAILAMDFRMGLDSGFLLGFSLSFSFALSGFVRKADWRKRSLYSFLLSSSLVLPMLFSSGSLHLLSPLYSLFLAPIVYPFHAAALLSFILKLPFVSFLGGYADFLLAVSGLLEPADIVVPVLGDIAIFSAVYYLLLFLFLVFSELGLSMFRKGTAALGAAFLLLNCVPYSSLLGESVHFIDVGQGDSTLMISGGEAVLVDTGGNLSFDMAKEVLVPYFRKQRVYSLKALILTHGDFDHDGAKDSLISSFPVGQVLDEPSDFPFRFGNTEIENINSFGGADENENSLILRFELASASFLLMGDAGKKTEERLLESGTDVDADVLKIGHHGSDSSSFYPFLEAVSPSLAVISCGEGNRYGHPEPAVLSRLSSLGIEVRRTDLEGTIELFAPFATSFAL